MFWSRYCYFTIHTSFWPLSGIAAIAGHYGVIASVIFAAAFGGKDSQTNGPTGPMTVAS